MPTIARTAVRMKDDLVVGRSPYTPPRVDRNRGNDVARSRLAVEVSVGIARVWVEPFARRVEYLAHSASIFLASLLRISSSILGVM